MIASHVIAQTEKIVLELFKDLILNGQIVWG